MKSTSLLLCKNSIRILLFIITVGSFLSCGSGRQKITITGTTAGLDGYVVSLNLNDSILAGENITNGQFSINTTVPQEDFYMLKLHSNNAGKPNQDFLIYLTEGEYSFQTDSAVINRYPLISSGSQVQNDLAEYYRIQDKNSEQFQKEYQIIKQAYDSDAGLDPLRFNKIAEQFISAETKLAENSAYSKKQFIAQNPESIVSAYFLGNSSKEIEYDAGAYLQIYEKLGTSAKESKYGKSAKKLIDMYTKASPNTLLPDISGTMPDGSNFDKNSLKGKISLVMFWMSSNKDSRDDIEKLIQVYEELHPRGFEIVGIAFDTSKERYLNYISQHKLPWIQVYDSEWSKSANMKNFGNYNLPYYFLVGPDLKIIERNPPIESIAIYHQEFMASKAEREKMKD